MKRFVVLLAVLTLAIPLMAGSSFADSDKTIVYSDDDRNLCTAAGIDADISLSKGVSLHYTSTPQAYGMTTGHMSGNKMYTTTYDTTLLYWQGSTQPNEDLKTMDHTDSTGIDGTWTEM